MRNGILHLFTSRRSAPFHSHCGSYRPRGHTAKEQGQQPVIPLRLVRVVALQVGKKAGQGHQGEDTIQKMYRPSRPATAEPEHEPQHRLEDEQSLAYDERPPIAAVDAILAKSA